MKELKITISGRSPLMVHNGDLANPMNEWARKIAVVAHKRSKEKTEEDYALLSWLEFRGGLYYDEKIGPYLPGAGLVSAFRDAARMSKRGTKIERGFQALCLKNPLGYDGPRSPEKMFKAGTFTYQTMVKVGMAKVLRTRALFGEWSCVVPCVIDAEVLDTSDLEEILKTGGRLHGMFESRKLGYGRYEAVIS